MQTRLWEEPAGRWVFHVDMDAFFASVEQRDDPRLVGQPVVVANSPLPLDKLCELARQALDGPPVEFIKGVRGVVASASYEARAFGVRSAMPLARALVLCPQAVVLPGRFDRYHQVAATLRQIWAEFSPVVEPVSFDEAYLDMTGGVGGYDQKAEGNPRLLPTAFRFLPASPEGIAEQLKARIKSETGLTASVGVGSSKLMAKIASDLEKPDGLVVIAHGDEVRTLAPLPVRALPGVGPRTGEALRKMGIATLCQLATTPHEVLARAFGSDHAASLLRRAVGIDASPVQAPGDPKSVSNEITLAEDTCDLAFLRERLRELAGRVALALRRDGLVARCIYIKLRLLPAKRVWQPEGSRFGKLITRQVSIQAPTDAAQEVYAAAERLLETAASDTGILEGRQVARLLGVGAASLCRIEDRGWGSGVRGQGSESA